MLTILFKKLIDSFGTFDLTVFCISCATESTVTEEKQINNAFGSHQSSEYPRADVSLPLNINIIYISLLLFFISFLLEIFDLQICFLTN